MVSITLYLTSFATCVLQLPELGLANLADIMVDTFYKYRPVIKVGSIKGMFYKYGPVNNIGSGDVI